MTGFWEAFWPNLASTLTGVLLGVPFALWINRKVIAQAEEVRREGDRRRVAHALQVLNRALAHNLSQLREFGAMLASSRITYDTGLDTSAWEAVKSDLATELSDPEIRQRLAYHFARLSTLVKLNEEYLHFINGIGASMTTAPDAKQTLHGVITSLVVEVEEGAAGLVAQIGDEHERLIGKALPNSTSVVL